MDLRPLRHFLAVADTLHFGQAAQRLGMTQPPLSQSILALERELGAPLFTRSKRNVALTAFGRQWLEHVRPAVEAISALPDIARRLRDGSAGQIGLSFVSTADYSLLPALVRDYAARFPEVEIALTEATSDVQIADLIDGVNDAGILIAPDGALPDALAYMPLLREPLVVAVPEGWVADDQAQGDPWLDRPLILFPRRVAPAFHDLVSGYLAGRGQPLLIRQEAIQMQTIISLVSAGMGIALVPASLRNLARTGVRYLDLRDAPILETGLAWRRHDDGATLAGLLGVARAMA
ncbi:LysR family transcriptional regulator [Sphingobium yanoikuyae]|uniref:LysR family transcriptional regulator n=1 Tax=Sphingobium yanoikuyae TaxID=13690 RepID=A0A085K9N4_SPHYA|nr:LysR family transcriptional regulator [Sphingobium yanoikuyae]AYO77636.1 LysR family transcriptional regulator [Sphingobium yanoikuyae]KFD29430.1 LysR family transcriptional regulator [Sphingobium yanoikuyae]KZC81800.1 LysR family transcriptional regulator [Sphingobium yanoikuyae]MDV3478988.1 LysR family transcriptional regulator [Sphingobium yanoikuyae]